MVQARELERIITLIPDMSTPQLDRLTQEINASRQFAGQETADSVNDELLLYICSFTKKHNLDYRTPITMRKSRHYKQFMTKHGYVLEYLSSFCKTKLEREALCHMVFSKIRQEGIVPMGCVGLMSVIHLIPAMIERLFPGYEEMGLLPLIARRLAAS